MTFPASQQIVLASSNPGKIREIQTLLHAWSIVPQARLNVPDIEETGASFIENALIKARHAARCSGLPAIADDSGLVVDALRGAPGIFSARYAGQDSNDRANLQKLLKDMSGVPGPLRTARFVCVMVFLQHPHDPRPLVGEGVWEGWIAEEAAGENGFGYDPVFWLPEQGCTSAQLSANKKNSLSHRGKALHQLSGLLKKRLWGYAAL